MKRRIKLTERKVDDIVEEAVSERRNVKDILVEMKDNIDLMIDLAYSALLANSVEIAEEVKSLEERMDEIQYEIETMLLVSARNIHEAEDIAGILHVALSLENIADAADDITDVVRRGVGDHPIYRTIFGETKEQVVKVVVSENSKLIGKTIGDLQVFKKFGCYIRAIKRRSKWIFTPDRDTILMADDVLIVNGGKSEVSCFKEQL